jgi:lysophospholipase L1-like esterase
VAAVSLALVASCLLPSPNTHAEDGFSWTNSVLITNSSETTPYTGLDEQGRPDWGGGCVYQQVYVGNLATAPNDICIFQGNGFRYGILLEPVSFGSFVTYNRSFVIGFSNDTRMYKVQDAPVNRILWTPYSSDIIYRAQSTKHSGYDLLIIKNIRSKITTTTNPDFSRGYKMISVHSQLLLNDEEGDGTPVGEVASSLNGRWLAAQIYDKGLVRIDLRDYSKRWFSDYHIPDGIEGSITDLAISAEGNYVAAVGSRISPFMTDLTSGCGRTLTTFQQEWALKDGTPLASPCPARQLNTTFGHAAGGDIDTIQRPSFDSTGNKLMAYVKTQASAATPELYKDISISSSTYDYDYPQIDYLALGDSYSSGEGDTEKDRHGYKYYRNMTDQNEDKANNRPAEKCHVSTRSYPYLLARSMNLTLDSPREWNTVACSGAKIWDLKEQASEQYEGQGKRLIDYDYQQLKSTALNEFIPGRQKQVEFVKKNRPKMITLTIGGNDIGFGEKVDACVRSISTCDFAKPGNRIKLKNELLRQYDELVDLYQELAKVSYNQTKIYVLGYPQFINSVEGARCNNIYLLDAQERKMITESITYLNRIIQKASERAGVFYIDIEGGLGNHKICDSNEQHVTAITNIFGWNGNEANESFHPNAKGHDDIARAFKARLNNINPLNYNTCPGSNKKICPKLNVTKSSIITPGYFNTGTQTESVSYQKVSVVNAPIIKTKSYNLNIFQQILNPSSIVSIILHSEPVSLGEYFAEDDGSINVNITIPSYVAPGIHTLTLAGVTYSGEPVEYYEVVEVQGTDPNDVDEDGIQDDVDECMYINPVNVDDDRDGIDDACDPLLSRQADASPNMNGSGIAYASGDAVSTGVSERNVNASPDNSHSVTHFGDWLKNMSGQGGLNWNKFVIILCIFVGIVLLLVINKIRIKSKSL